MIKQGVMQLLTEYGRCAPVLVLLRGLDDQALCHALGLRFRGPVSRVEARSEGR